MSRDVSSGTLEKEAILNLGEVHGCEAFYVAVSNLIFLRSYGLARVKHVRLLWDTSLQRNPQPYPAAS